MKYLCSPKICRFRKSSHLNHLVANLIVLPGHWTHQRMGASYNKYAQYFRTLYTFNSAAFLNMANMKHPRRTKKIQSLM